MKELVEQIKIERQKAIEMLNPESWEYRLMSELEKTQLKLAILDIEIKLNYLGVEFEKYNYD